ncbi:hypothetical protein CK510_19970 [Brunnivagina elsteri CCALA 953]|uniref:NACHT domain-containing protein n=1 Tax=Brunnivagina elsteri CCALA 953 TaxID=987040 RepID=A0A2A2TF52_9CYAN|nr:NACHT domain-containing protein [Calothrix elsteri]PAX52321.1 hypothetical protein CK510_19970 [Calothrix elsteri CCALA 953]
MVLKSLIDKIAEITVSFIKNKLERNEVVIKILKQFDLDPEHPPEDFEGVYAYALVEYGIGKPKAILNLFRLKKIQNAFRKTFEQNNFSILEKVSNELIENDFGNEIRQLEIEPRRELIAFSAIFIEVVKRSRTPKEVLTQQKIESIHKRVEILLERLERLPTLEGIRTEMARLVQQNYLALPLAETLASKKSSAFGLSQEMRGWFETLGYRFEKYEIWENNYFEWIINIPVRRNRYDRVLIRGMVGEANINSLMALSSSVEKNHTDEGWLVTARRISQAARNEVEKSENRHLSCYTFDELIDQDADFSGYLDWLEAEVVKRGINKKYVPLSCTKEEIHPATKRAIAVSRYSDIGSYIDRWLSDPAKEHISILGEFGTGKTWFALHYAWVALQKYRDCQKRGIERPRLPLVISLRDYAKAVSVESLFSEFFFRKYEIPIPGYSAFEQLNRMGKLLLIFDGFDEMAARVDRQAMVSNFWELAKVLLPGAKVILTCRTEHFPEAIEGRALLSAKLQASITNLTGETPQFEVLELEKFGDEQIRQVLSFQATPATVERVMGNPQLLDLAGRPVMTELILEALPDIEEGKPVDMSRVYLYAVRRKMERDITAERTFTSLADKLYFLCELSWEMLSTNQLSLNYRLFPDRVRRLFGAVVREEKDLDHWKNDMLGQTMLIRNADGDYTPAHKSLLEFFVAYKFAAELGVLAPDFTELAQAQAQNCLDKTIAPEKYTWSSYFQRKVNKAGEILAIAPLKEFASESLEYLQQTFGQTSLTKAAIDLLMPMLVTGDLPMGDREKESIVKILQATRDKTKEEVGYIGGNAATLLVKLDKAALEDKDFSQTVIINADLSNASLRNINFAFADLTDCIFTKISGKVSSVAFSPDGKLLATGDSQHEIRLWDAASGSERLVCKGHTSWVNSVVFSPDGLTLASTSGHGLIKLWDINDAQCIKILQGHTSWINSVKFSPDGKILASAGDDHTLRLWDVYSGKCLRTLHGHTRYIESVAFSPDGKTLATGSGDTTIKLWDSSTGNCVKTLKHDKPYEGMKIEGIKGLSETAIATLKALGAVDGK